MKGVSKIAHSVICYYCSEKFDRDKVAYAKVTKNRYAHADCALREAAKTGAPAPIIVDPNDFVTCVYCKKVFNKNETEYELLTNGKYAHKECAALEATRERTDAEKLDDYIMKLFNYEYVPPRIRKQINTFMQEYNYTYTGMLKALKYFYEIKGNPIQEKYGISILPYVYKDAYNYYYALWEAQQKNEGKKIADYVPVVREIRIPIPQRNIEKRSFFSFLDEEVEE